MLKRKSRGTDARDSTAASAYWRSASGFVVATARVAITGAAGGFESDVGILDHQAIGGRHVKLLCGEEKDIGGGFSMGDIIAAGDGVEKLGKASQRKDGI